MHYSTFEKAHSYWIWTLVCLCLTCCFSLTPKLLLKEFNMSLALSALLLYLWAELPVQQNVGKPVSADSISAYLQKVPESLPGPSPKRCNACPFPHVNLQFGHEACHLHQVQFECIQLLLTTFCDQEGLLFSIGKDEDVVIPFGNLSTKVFLQVHKICSGHVAFHLSPRSGWLGRTEFSFKGRALRLELDPQLSWTWDQVSHYQQLSCGPSETLLRVCQSFHCLVLLRSQLLPLLPQMDRFHY